MLFYRPFRGRKRAGKIASATVGPHMRTLFVSVYRGLRAADRPALGRLLRRLPMMNTEPRALVRQIVIPLGAFAAFLLVWTGAARRIALRSGGGRSSTEST